MFRAMITPIFRSTRLCVTAYGIMHPRCSRCRLPGSGASRQPATATSWVHYTISCNTQSSAPEDGRDHRPKHVAMIGIINKPLLLHLVSVYIIYGNYARSNIKPPRFLVLFLILYWALSKREKLQKKTLHGRKC